MSSGTPSGPAGVDATPTPDAPRPVLQESDTAVRAAVGRHTVDIVAADHGLLAMAGHGVGTPPVPGMITPPAAATIVAMADYVDERTAWDTQAWPLTIQQEAANV